MAHSGDEYVHRIGRTGRAGNDGTAISFITANEWNLAAGIQRYLKQSFEAFVIPGLEAKYKGPKKLKSSGQAASKKSKKAKASLDKGKGKGKGQTTKKKRPTKQVESQSENKNSKQRHRDRKNIGKRRRPTQETLDDSVIQGLAPPKKQR